MRDNWTTAVVGHGSSSVVGAGGSATAAAGDATPAGVEATPAAAPSPGTGAAAPAAAASAPAAAPSAAAPPGILLLPYRRSFVPTYHAWMADPYLLASTSSERLSEAEELAAQRAWVDDPQKCTFIVFDLAAHAAAGAYGHTTRGMLGDANLFLLDGAGVAEDYFGGAPCPSGGRAAEVMVMVAEPAYRRRGYAQRAVAALLWYGATALGLRRFVAKVSEDNTASLALFTQRLGFREARRVAAFQEVHLVLEVGEGALGGGFELAQCLPAPGDDE
jgi:RimJ/RimL family protein N-acetyltransferase